MKKVFFVVMLSYLMVSVAHSRTEIRSLSSDSVSIKQYPLFASDKEVRYQAEKACRKFGKKASDPVGRSCDPQEQLCVNPIIHFACIDK